MSVCVCVRVCGGVFGINWVVQMMMMMMMRQMRNEFVSIGAFLCRRSVDTKRKLSIFPIIPTERVAIAAGTGLVRCWHIN